MRSRIFQDEIALRLKDDKDLQIVNIGAGFDSRPYRLAGGRWYDIDEPALIAHKNTCAPVETCGNPLRRIPVDFANGELPAALVSAIPVLTPFVVIEGVLMYLDTVRVERAIRAAQRCFSSAYFDLRVDGQDVRQQISAQERAGADRGAGQPILLLEDHPERMFLGSGYKRSGEPISVVGRARDFKAMTIPGFLLKTVLRSMRDGYRVLRSSSRDRRAAGAYQSSLTAESQRILCACASSGHRASPPNRPTVSASATDHRHR